MLIKDTKHKSYKEYILIILVMIVAIVTRIAGIGIYPGGINADEAYGGYEAWAMLHYGTDSWGYHNPVYLTTWGSGMSVLNSILMIPFIRMWGLNTITIRLPQAIIGILSVWGMYLLLKKIAGTKTALTGMALMAICPWHIMMSRWGLDCNLAPGFMLFAAYFFVLGLDKEKFFIVSAFMWGLSLYCYATVWIIVPLLLLTWGIYSYKHHKIKVTKWTVISCAIIGLMALPLMLFVAVNMGWIPEIRTTFLSIPQLVDFRSDEIGLANMIGNAKAFIRLLITQNDGLIWNTIPYFGMYYLFSLPFILIGAMISFKKTYDNIKSGKFCYEVLTLLWLFIAVIVGILQGVNANKMNNINIPIIILWSEGIVWVCQKGKKYAAIGICAIYVMSFGCFETYYYTTYQEQISQRQQAGAGEALQAAMRIRENGYDNISVPDVVRHSAVLFYTQWPLDNYLDTITWQSYPERWLKAADFGCFTWQRENEEIAPLNKDTVYIFMLEDEAEFEEKGWQKEYYGCCGVAYFKQNES